MNLVKSFGRSLGIPKLESAMTKSSCVVVLTQDPPAPEEEPTAKVALLCYLVAFALFSLFSDEKPC